MPYEYRIKDQSGIYFITCTVSQWVDVFTRSIYIDVLLDSLRFCQKEKGLRIYAWVIMTNHIHLIISSEQNNLSDIIRDFKKYTATQVYKTIESNERESRKSWLLWLLKREGKIWFWKTGYHGAEITTKRFADTKIDYIHQNPVRASLVEKEEEYSYSSACDFHGNRKGLLVIEPM